MANAAIVSNDHRMNVQRRRRRQIAGKKRLNDDTLLASSAGDAEWLEQALKSNHKTAVTQTKEQGLSTIHLAATNGHLDCLKILIEKQHVPVDYESASGWRATHLAINNKNKSRSLKCLNYLLDHGADPSKPNQDGFTPIHQAAATGHVKCLRALIEAGATIDTCDSERLLPVDYARIWGHRTCVRILDAKQWHIDKQNELLQRLKLEKESHKQQQVLEKVSIKVKAKKVENDKAVFESWLETKGLSDQVNCSTPSTPKLVTHKPMPEAKTTPSPILPKVNTTGVVGSFVAEPTAELKPYFYPYFDEFDEEKKLDLIPLASNSEMRRKQRAQDMFSVKRDGSSRNL